MERDSCRHHFLCPPSWTADQDGTVEAACRFCGERRLSVRLLELKREDDLHPPRDRPG
jgi:hypothetical protein